MTRLAPVAALLAALALVACARDDGRAGAPTGAEGRRLSVVTSLGIFADFVREVGGNRVEVASLLPPGADPHTYEPRPKDVQTLTEADIVFINGLGLEGSLERTIVANVSDRDRVVYLSGIQGPTDTVPDDVHRWLDASEAVEYVSRVRDALVKADPDGETRYRTGAEGYTQELRDLDETIEAQLDPIPDSHRKLVTFHRSFNTFADRYGFDVAGFVVASPGGDPIPQDIADLTRAINDDDLPAVFAEPGFNSELLDQLAADTGARVCTLYSDALSDDVPTYIDMMRFNADELLRCLGDAGG